MIANAIGTNTENAFPKFSIIGVKRSFLAPSVWNADANQCHKWNIKTSIATT